MKYLCGLITFLLLFFFSACAPKVKATVVLLDNGHNRNAIIVANTQGSKKIDKAGSYVDLKDTASVMSSVKVMPKEEIDKRFSKVLATAPLKPLSYILYFKENSKELTDASKEELKKALEVMQKRALPMVDIIGHTDTTGSNELNVKVSLKRAKYIEKIIKEKKIKVVSLVAKGYGEEDLFVKTQNNKAEAKNRNVEIFIK